MSGDHWRLPDGPSRLEFPAAIGDFIIERWTFTARVSCGYRKLHYRKMTLRGSSFLRLSETYFSKGWNFLRLLAISLSNVTSDSILCENIVRACSLEDAKYFTRNWFTRVPTKSNIADGPSRLEFPTAIGNFVVERCEITQPKTLKFGSWT